MKRKIAVAVTVLIALAAVCSSYGARKIEPKFGFGMAGGGPAHAGDVITFTVDAAGRAVAVANMSLIVPTHMSLLHACKSPCQLIKSRPTWVLKNFTDPFKSKTFSFSLRIAKNVRAGTKLHVVVVVDAFSADKSWSRHGALGTYTTIQASP